MMNLMNMFVEEFCVQETMNVVEEHIVKNIVGKELVNETSEAGNVQCAIRHNIRCEVIKEIKHHPNENRPSDINVKKKNAQHLEISEFKFSVVKLEF